MVSSSNDHKLVAYEDSLDVLEVEKGKAFPPRFIRELKPQTFVEGQSLTLNVEVEAFPNATFTWFVDGVNVTSSSTVRITSHNNKSSATFAKPTKGNYLVKAENSAGKATSQAYMSFKSK